MRILVVDDSAGIGLVLTRYFERADHLCEHLLDAATALQRLESPPLPDVVLVDLVMPGMSGREFVAEMRRRPGMRELPVVLLSGYAANTDDLPPAGSYHAVVAKPFDLQELSAVLVAATSDSARRRL